MSAKAIKGRQEGGEVASAEEYRAAVQWLYDVCQEIRTLTTAVKGDRVIVVKGLKVPKGESLVEYVGRSTYERTFRLATLDGRRKFTRVDQGHCRPTPRRECRRCPTGICCSSCRS